MKTLAIGLIASLLVPTGQAYTDNTYSVWSEDIHLIMSDNGTPTDYDDDWVVDWEDNREVIVTVLD